MRPVIVTDVRYRTALAVIRPLARAGYPVWAVQTKAECPAKPAAFYSKYGDERVLLEGSVRDEAYAGRLLALCRKAAEAGERPVLFPIGADTLATLSHHKEEFRKVCDFLVAPPEILDAANDKKTVAKTAEGAGVPVPKEYDPAEGLPPLPVIIKPRCGEKLGLHAEARYKKAFTPEEYQKALETMRAYDPEPVVQELVSGDGAGVCLVMDENSRPVTVICHKRIREYPISGGPSACCISFYEENMVKNAVRLLQALHFTGIAMVEFKGDRVLEINPRIWGSFPLTDACGSHFAENYVRAASGEIFDAPDDSYRRGVRMRFLLNDTLSVLSYLRHRKFRKVLAGAADVFRAREALFRFRDQRPFWRYLHLTLRGKGGRT